MNTISFAHFALAIMFWLSLGGILYTYFGYPLIIAICSAFLQKEKFPAGDLPSVTLLIAALNEEAVIKDKIQNSISIDYPKDRLQILVVTDGSSDSTPQIASAFKNSGVEALHNPERRGKMAAINRAMAHVKNEIVIFSDANNYYQSDTIRKLVEPFSDPKVGATTGAKLIEKGDGNLGASEGLYWKYESRIKQWESRLGSCTSAAGEILAIRKNLYVAPPPKIINDDFFIAMQVVKQDYRLIYVPEAISRERVSPTARDEIVRRTRINAGRFQTILLARQILPFRKPLLIWQIVSHKFLRPLVPFFMLFAALTNLFAVIFPPNTDAVLYLGKPFSVIALSAQAVFYALAWIGAQSSDAGEQSRIRRLLYIPTFLVNSNLAALNGFVQFVRGRQFHLWERIERR